MARRAERLTRARRRPQAVWSALMRVVGLGWVFVLPLAAGAAGGRLLARWLGPRWVALAGLALGLAAGAYGVFRQVKLGLEEDEARRGEEEEERER
ncbi:MAG: AtpZ/AtpI family protein [Labilithrix sp.]|nr:AtpZ/AtpI family protein [Labilithrix sp.]MCW5830928.1 AtpZ/AtpI family protein [Labilithrix sp.]